MSESKEEAAVARAAAAEDKPVVVRSDARGYVARDGDDV